MEASRSWTYWRNCLLVSFWKRGRPTDPTPSVRSTVADEAEGKFLDGWLAEPLRLRGIVWPNYCFFCFSERFWEWNADGFDGVIGAWCFSSLNALFPNGTGCIWTLGASYGSVLSAMFLMLWLSILSSNLSNFKVGFSKNFLSLYISFYKYLHSRFIFSFS